MTFLHRQTHSRAFTIVELVIVISVIGILAAITVVGYNGYQERARTAAAIAGVDQAADLLEAYQLKNGGLYPTSLSSAGITDTGSVTYQYTQVSGGTNYCVTATSKNISYKMTQDAKPTAGGCAGHGSNGIAAVTNGIVNPSFESNITNWNAFSTTGSVGMSVGASGAFSGTKTLHLVINSGTAGFGGAYSYNNPIVGGKTYTISAYIKSNNTKNIYPAIEWHNGSGNTGTYNGSAVSVSSSWTRLSFTSTAPASATLAVPTFYTTGGSSLNTGDVIDIDGVMLTEGNTTYTYADGNSSNWVWNGTANNSTSTGPPL